MKVTIGCFEIGKKYALDMGEPFEDLPKHYFPHNRSAGTGIFEGYDSVDNTYTFSSDEYGGILKLRYLMDKDYPCLYPIKEFNIEEIYSYLTDIEKSIQRIKELLS